MLLLYNFFDSYNVFIFLVFLMVLETGLYFTLKAYNLFFVRCK